MCPYISLEIYAETSYGTMSTWGTEHKVTKAHNTNGIVISAFAKQLKKTLAN